MASTTMQAMGLWDKILN